MEQKRTIRIVIGIVLILVFGCTYLWFSHSEEASVVLTEEFKDKGEKQEKAREELSSHIYIHICGEVKKPGVYVFENIPRVVDVVKKAGGFTSKAKQDCINMAQQVEDGQQLIIEKKGQSSGQSNKKPNRNKGTDSNKIDINTASKEELMTLSGIGESKATQIISYRESNGHFSKIEDIMNISGIKDGVFNKIKDYITV